MTHTSSRQNVPMTAPPANSPLRARPLPIDPDETPVFSTPREAKAFGIVEKMAKAGCFI